MSKQMFSEQLVDLMSEYIYSTLGNKTLTKASIKKSIRSFENMWITTVRGAKKNVKRKS
tara:strand:- start:189 stop:365 length:177 start_codon:yes stop_codon:yes gene_type:complete